MNIWLLQSSEVNSQMLILLSWQVGNFPYIGHAGYFLLQQWLPSSPFWEEHVSCPVTLCHFLDKGFQVLTSTIQTLFWVLIQKFQSPTWFFQEVLQEGSVYYTVKNRCRPYRPNPLFTGLSSTWCRTYKTHWGSSLPPSRCRLRAKAWRLCLFISVIPQTLALRSSPGLI